ncbi:MAG: shikimate dehydrogenase [Gemmatimonadota bacterium]
MTLSRTSGTRLVALLGDPVRHSLSPTFQNAAFHAAELDAIYVALRCDAADVPGLIAGLARAGGAGNVTVPHKRVAARAVERATAAVERTGACNTFWLESGVVCGDNTDVVGFGRAVEDLLGGPPRGARVLLIGAGGAAGAALCSLLDEQAEEVLILNRTHAKARALAERFAGSTTRIHIAEDLEASDAGNFDLAVNATSLGLRPDDPLPMEIDARVTADAVLDMVYSPRRTRWVREHLARGTRASDGLEMLLHQGAAAFERWWGIPAPIPVMRAALPPR